MNDHNHKEIIEGCDPEKLKAFVICYLRSWTLNGDEYSVEDYYDEWLAELTKPKTIMISGVECIDDFITEAPKIGFEYYVESILREDFFMYSRWINDIRDKFRLRRGVIHRTREGAAQAVKARYGIKD